MDFEQVNRGMGMDRFEAGFGFGLDRGYHWHGQLSFTLIPHIAWSWEKNNSLICIW